MDDVFVKKLDDAMTWLQGEYASIRSGQATPALLDSIKVESYGTTVPLNQIGSIGIEDARTLRVSPWDASQVKTIETALTEADLGVSVATDSSGVRVIFPELTSERRVQLLKLAKSKLEDARVRIRGSRDEVLKRVEASHKSGDMSDDKKFSEKEKIQKENLELKKKLEQKNNN